MGLLKSGFSGPVAGDAVGLAQRERGFLVPGGADESRRADLLKQKRISAKGLHLIIMPTEDCNFRCRYCYESFLRGRMPAPIRRGIKKWVSNEIAKLDRLDVSWFGGEPMEQLDVLEELSHSMIGAARASNVPYSASIVTNGSHLSPENLRRLVECEVRSIQVTIDGLPLQHDRLRVTKDGHPTFEKIWANVKAARRVPGKFHLSIRVNFNTETLEKMEEFLAMAAADLAGDPRFSVFFRPVGHWGGPNDSQVLVCSKAAGETAQFDSARQAQKAGLQSGNTFSFMRPGGSVCYAANPRSFVVGSDGTLYKCTVALDKEFNKVGRLREDGLPEIDQDRFALWTTSDDSKDAVCQSCSFRPACQGAACPLVRIETGQRPCPPVKNRLRRALLAVWDHYQKFGKPEPVTEGGVGARD
ncbi:MAG: radical SAM protein [Elusimicrobiota bacterium]